MTLRYLLLLISPLFVSAIINAQDVEWNKLSVKASSSDHLDILNIDSKYVHVLGHGLYRSSTTNVMQKRLFTYDKHTLEEVDVMAVDDLRDNRCDILDVTAILDSVYVVSRCRRKGRAEMRLVVYDRVKDRTVKEDVISTVEKDDGLFLDPEVVISNDSIFAYKEISDRYKMQSDHYYVFDKTQGYKLIDEHVVKRDYRRRQREQVLAYAVSDYYDVVYLQSKQEEDADKYSLELFVLGASDGRSFEVPSEVAVHLTSIKIRFAKDTTVLIAMAEEERGKGTGVTGLRLMRYHLEDGLLDDDTFSPPQELKTDGARSSTVRIVDFVDLDQELLLLGQEEWEDEDYDRTGYGLHCGDRFVWRLTKDFDLKSKEFVYNHTVENAFKQRGFPSGFYNQGSGELLMFANLEEGATIDYGRTETKKMKFGVKKCMLASWYYGPEGGVVNTTWFGPSKRNAITSSIAFDRGYVYLLARDEKMVPYVYLGKMPIEYAF